MKKSELKKSIQEEIFEILAEADQEDIDAQADLNKELEKTVALSKELTTEDEDAEPSKAELAKSKSLAKAKEEVAQLTKKMKAKAKEYKAAEGDAKEKIKDELKKMTAEKKKLEKLL